MRTFVVCAILVFGCLTIACGLQNLVSVGHGVAVGESMAPTIKTGDHFGYGIFKAADAELVERFDIIVFKVYAGSEIHIKEDQKFIFRVIAREGEKVEIRKGKVFINDQLLQEPFDKIEANEDFASLTIPQGEYFVMGDNRPESFDSRYWKYKTVKRKDVLGIVSNIVSKEDYDNGKRL